MTESRVENLLQQMTLSGPSAALDERVEICLNSAVRKTFVASAGFGSWGLLSAVAVACLVIGVIAGHRIASTSAAVTDTQGGDSTVNMKTTGTASQDDVVERFAENSETIVTVDREDLFEQLQGPSVTMLCTMEHTGNPQATKGEQCLVCHAGLPAAQSRFRKEHMRLPGFATCMWCHDTSKTE